MSNIYKIFYTRTQRLCFEQEILLRNKKLIDNMIFNWNNFKYNIHISNVSLTDTKIHHKNDFFI